MGASLFPREMDGLRRKPIIRLLVFCFILADGRPMRLKGIRWLPRERYIHFDSKTAVYPGAEKKVRGLLAGGYKGHWGVEYNAPNNQYWRRNG